MQDHIYQNADDWTKTLGRNYDLFGKNNEIHHLYIGASHSAGIRQEMGKDEDMQNTCYLVENGQDLQTSLYLLKKADQRYRLTDVTLEFDCWYFVDENDYELFMEPGKAPVIQYTAKEKTDLEEAEIGYLQEMIAYCSRRGLKLRFWGISASDTNTRSPYLEQILEIAREYGIEYGDAISSPA